MVEVNLQVEQVVKKHMQEEAQQQPHTQTDVVVIRGDVSRHREREESFEELYDDVSFA